MIVFHATEELSAALGKLKEQGLRIALVPTMGALHAGHLSLITKAQNYADKVVCSIFINPTQFNNAGDLEKYPRTIDSDLELLEKVGCDLVFLPEVDEMYPEGTSSNHYQLGLLDEVMEGKFRPGHFDGVATVVSRFFDMIQPDVAVFGEKDFQQVAVIRKMVEQDCHPVEIVTCPIAREENGLAMSSRNQRLTDQQRKRASCIYEAMLWAQKEYKKYSPLELTKMLEERINAEPGFDVEYVAVCHAQTLEPVTHWSEAAKVQLCVAVFCGEIRLIDNLSLF